MRRATALALLLAAGCLHARGTPEEPVVLSVALEGAASVDRPDLLEKLATHASDRLPWGRVSRLDPDALAVDRRRVEAFYRERGFYRAAVEKVDLLPEGEGRARVVFHVREGTPVRVSRVVVEGLEAAPEAAAAVGALGIAPGQVFTEQAFDAAREKLAAALAHTGYATGTVTQAAQVLPDDGTAEVTYRVAAGPRYRLGRIEVTGTVAVPLAKVAAQAAREATPGEWFDEARLERLQARVFGLGVFSGVRVARGTPDEAAGTLPLVVAVREAPFHTLRLGPGLGFQAARWDAQAQAAWTVRNWLGGLRRLQLEAKAGWAWLPDPISPEREGLVGRLAAEFSQPGAIGEVVDFSTRLELEKGLEPAYGAFAERLRVGLPFQPGPRWNVAPSYNLEVYQLTELAGSAIAGLPQLRNCPGRICLLSYLEQRISWDGRDHPLTTTRGIYAALAVQEGFPVGGQGYAYLRFLPEVRFFWPLGRRTVLAGHARLGALVPINETGPAPVVALLSAGGASSMRGYGAGRLSPMSLQDGRWIPTGGNGLLEGSLEVRQALGGSWTGALFLDAANVSEASGIPGEYRTVLDPSRLQLAAGVGLRYGTLFGPLRVDLGGRLPSDWSSGVPFAHRFPAVPGSSGHREPVVALHVSLGEAF